VQEDEEGAEEAAQQAQHHAGDQRQDVDVDPVLDLEEDVLLRRELTKTWGEEGAAIGIRSFFSFLLLKDFSSKLVSF